MKNIFKILLVLLLALNVQSFVFAEEIINENIEILTEENTEEETITEEEIIKPKAHIFIRAGEEIVFDGEIEFENSGTKTITDSSNTTHEIAQNSVLGVLTTLDEQSSLFFVNDLSYYSAFNAFYLRCITPLNKEALCDNWQYVVNGITPWQGLDAILLSGGENLAFYFGTPHRVSLEKNSFEVDENFVAKAEKYNYLDNTWGILDTVNLGIIKDNIENPWSPIIVEEKLLNEQGQTDFVISEIGEYKIGIKEDYYFPSYNISVIAKASTGGGGGSGGGIITHNVLDIPKALAFLQSKQNSNGSLNEDLYTDWLAIAYAKTPNADLNKIKDFLLTDILDTNLLTDYERRAMALMALGINPYNGTNVNYIERIVKSFDGEQFGDKNLYNDDIFALIILPHAGYDLNDEMFTKSIAFAISKQKADGSFDGVDMTGASLVAFSKFPNVVGVSESINKMLAYLQNTQEANGGWLDAFSTSWASAGLIANSLNISSWEKNNLNPNDYLYKLQKEDGGVLEIDISENQRIWATAYAMPVAQNLSWHDILNNFSKIIPVSSSGENQNPKDNTDNISLQNSIIQNETEKNQIQEGVKETEVEQINDSNQVVLGEVLGEITKKEEQKKTGREIKTVLKAEIALANTDENNKIESSVVSEKINENQPTKEKNTEEIVLVFLILGLGIFSYFRFFKK